jgi:hypothetical protein
MADANAAVYGKKIQKNTVEDDEDDLADHKKGEKDEHTFPISDVSIQFQLLMILSALYYSMLLTNWMNPSQFTDGTASNSGMTAFWIKMVCEWLTILIFVFSIFAPVLFPNRFN